MRDGLAEQLPAYMVPALWAVVDRIPVTGNGKVDRWALAAVAAPPAAAAVPVDDLLLGLFAEAVGVSPGELDTGTDFFAVGGNSMGAVRLVRLVRDRLGVRMPLRDFLRTPTPDGMRRLVQQVPTP